MTSTTSNSQPAQVHLVYDYLKTGARLTALEAVQKFQCLRLGGRIFELRAAGVDVKSQLIKTGDGRKRVAEYWLEPEPRAQTA